MDSLCASFNAHASFIGGAFDSSGPYSDMESFIIEINLCLCISELFLSCCSAPENVLIAV